MAEAGLREAVLGSGAGGPLTAPTPWITFPGYIQYSGGVVVGSPAGGNKGPGTVNAANYFINGVQVIPSNYLLLSGGTMTGMLSLFSDPTLPAQAATKKYVDDQITAVDVLVGDYLPLAGGTLTGTLTMSGASIVLAADPTSSLQAATKQYVDSQFAGIIGIPDAPSDGTNYGRKNGAWADTSRIDVGTF